MNIKVREPFKTTALFLKIQAGASSEPGKYVSFSSDKDSRTDSSSNEYVLEKETLNKDTKSRYSDKHPSPTAYK